MTNNKQIIFQSHLQSTQPENFNPHLNSVPNQLLKHFLLSFAKMCHHEVLTTPEATKAFQISL